MVRIILRSCMVAAIGSGWFAGGVWAADKQFELELQKSTSTQAETLARNVIVREPSVKLADDLSKISIVAVEFKNEVLQAPLLVARLEDSSYCGTLGCLTFVFQQKREGWTLALMGNFERLWVSTSGEKLELNSEDGHGRKKTILLSR